MKLSFPQSKVEENRSEERRMCICVREIRKAYCACWPVLWALHSSPVRSSAAPLLPWVCRCDLVSRPELSLLPLVCEWASLLLHSWHGNKHIYAESNVKHFLLLPGTQTIWAAQLPLHIATPPTIGLKITCGTHFTYPVIFNFQFGVIILKETGVSVLELS